MEYYEKIESDYIEYKEMVEYKKPKTWLKTICAFANSGGGKLIIGIRDNDKIPVGLDNISYDAEKITELINTRIKPIPKYELKTRKVYDKDILEVEVIDSSRTPYYYENEGNREVYIRRGNQTISAEKHELDNLILKGQNVSFDELPSIYELSDVSFTLLNASLKRETGKSIDIEKDYLSLELFTKEGKITNAGLLLSDQGLIKQSRLFCTRWVGTSKGIIDSDAIDDKEYTGSIISLLSNGELFVKNNSHTKWRIEGMKRIESPDYPASAIREAIVNAIVHRDYQITGSEIHIDVFDDRVEITSPGGMIGGCMIQDMNIKNVASVRRNKIISDIFSRLNLMERRGSGLVRIYDAYKNYNVKPIFSSDYSTFKVIFPNLNNESSELINSEDNKKLNDEDYFIVKMYKCLPDNLNKNTKDNIFKLFKTYGYNIPFKRIDIERIFDVKKSRAGIILKGLVELDIIEPISSTSYKIKR